MEEQTKTISEYTIKELRAICQKTAPDPARESKVGKFSRVFSIYTTKLFLYTPLTPNHITILSVLVFFAGINLLLPGVYWLDIVGALVVFFSIILDGSDGEVARFRKRGGVLGGMYTEPVSHDLQYGLMFLLLAFRFLHDDWFTIYLFLGALAGVSKLEYRLLSDRFWMLTQGSIADDKIAEIKKQYTKKPWYVRAVYWFNKNFLSSTGIFLVLFVLTLLQLVEWYLWFFAIGYLLMWLALFGKQLIIIHRQRIR